MGLQPNDSKDCRSLGRGYRGSGHSRGELPVFRRHARKFQLKDPRHVVDGMVDENVQPRRVNRCVHGKSFRQKPRNHLVVVCLERQVGRFHLVSRYLFSRVQPGMKLKCPAHLETHDHVHRGPRLGRGQGFPDDRGEKGRPCLCDALNRIGENRPIGSVLAMHRAQRARHGKKQQPSMNWVTSPNQHPTAIEMNSTGKKTFFRFHALSHESTADRSSWTQESIFIEIPNLSNRLPQRMIKIGVPCRYSPKMFPRKFSVFYIFPTETRANEGFTRNPKAAGEPAGLICPP
jgi:hypothetical protein